MAPMAPGLSGIAVVALALAVLSSTSNAQRVHHLKKADLAAAKAAALERDASDVDGDGIDDLVAHANPGEYELNSDLINGEVEVVDEVVSEGEDEECITDSSCDEIYVDQPFQQHEAPTASTLWQILVAELKSKQKQPKDFSIHYKGSGVQAVVGAHHVRANVTYLTAMGAEQQSCFQIIFRIEDTDECEISADPELAAKYPDWVHHCHSSSQCVNAQGTYHCHCAAGGEFGALFSGSVKAQNDPDYEFTPGICHGFNNTETCCGVSTLSDIHEEASQMRSLQCHSKTCVENCKRDFTCERPCDAIDRAVSPRARQVATHLARATSDHQQVHEYNGMQTFFQNNRWQAGGGWRADLRCHETPDSASFSIDCPAGMEPQRGYDKGDEFPGFPLPYNWVDRSRKHSRGQYMIPILHNIELMCQEVQIKTFCDPRKNLQCPCGCRCLDAADYNQMHGSSGSSVVPLGTGFYCEPNEGFMAIEPLDFFNELQPLLTDWYQERYPPGHLLNLESPGMRNDTHICVDKTPPKVNIPAGQSIFYQGDPAYDPPHPTFHDKNINAELGRTIKLRMDSELYGEDGYLAKVGDWRVVFSMVTPWLEERHRTAEANIDLKILDVDECTYQGGAEAFKHRCYARSAEDAPNTADAICQNVVMTDDNKGPGFTCSCPDGYAGNAFTEARFFERHQQGKQELQALHATAAAGGDSRDFTTWMAQERGLVGGFLNDSDDPEATVCIDVRAPDLTCTMEPCPVIELEAASVEALVFTHMPQSNKVDALLQGESDIECKAKWDFVKKLLEEQDAVHKFCGQHLQHCLHAKDQLVDQVLDYQTDILVQSIEEKFEPASSESSCFPKCSAGDDTADASGSAWYCSALEYSVTFNVTDKAGNTAWKTLNISVLPMNVTKILADPVPTASSMMEALLSVPSVFSDGFVMRFIPQWMYNSVSLMFVGLAVILLYINGVFVCGVVVSFCRAVQVLLLPTSVANDRAAFDRGHVCLLWLQSAGTLYHMGAHQIETMLEEKWQQLQMETSS